jgi:hypothetical protein
MDFITLPFRMREVPSLVLDYQTSRRKTVKTLEEEDETLMTSPGRKTIQTQPPC